MTKYERLLNDLNNNKKGCMKCFGNSMLPILKNPTTNYYEVRDEYEIGDIVFCKVKGRYIDAHLITQKDISKGNKIRYMISNNHGRQNGWTYNVYGKVIKAIDKSGNIKEFNHDKM
jgi:hypothetical protein